MHDEFVIKLVICSCIGFSKSTSIGSKFPIVDPIVEQAPEITTEAINEPTPESMTEAIGEQIAPKKRGRKPKPKNVTEEQVPVGPGRPTLARNALETDVVPPVLRRSERSKK